jgi:hypothetical protein
VLVALLTLFAAVVASVVEAVIQIVIKVVAQAVSHRKMFGEEKCLVKIRYRPKPKGERLCIIYLKLKF